MKCLDCGAEMEEGTAECVGAGFENWYEFTPVIKKGKRESYYYQFDPYRENQLEADQVPAIKTFSQSIVKRLEKHSTEENRVIWQYGLSVQKIRRFADELGHVCDVAMEHGYGLSGMGD